MPVKVESFIFLADFLNFDCEVDFEVPIIFWRLFIATGAPWLIWRKGR